MFRIRGQRDEDLHDKSQRELDPASRGRHCGRLHPCVAATRREAGGSISSFRTRTAGSCADAFIRASRVIGRSGGAVQAQKVEPFFAAGARLSSIESLCRTDARSPTKANSMSFPSFYRSTLLRSTAFAFLSLTAGSALTACSESEPGGPSDATGGAGTGGLTATGGTSTGGTASGGAATGGASTGGASTGGAGTGGAGTGGAASGGAASGGTGSGGEASGGAGSGGDGSGGEGSGGADGTGGEGGGEFALTSAELSEGGEFPDAHTCASAMGARGFGEAISLAWSGFPAETQSFALVMLDVTLTESDSTFANLGYHSAFWNLPVSVTSLPEGSWATALAGAESISDGYLGPCPTGLQGAPPPPHTYSFTLYALPEATVSVGDPLDEAFIQTLESAAIAKTSLSGTSSAAQP